MSYPIPMSTRPPASRTRWGACKCRRFYSLNHSNHTLVPAFTNTYIYDSSDDGNYTVYPGLLYKVTDSQGFEKNGYDTRERLIKTTRHLNINSQHLHHQLHLQ